MRSQALKGHLDMLLLAAVSREPAHGYLVLERLREMSAGAFDLSEGTIYPALHRLEAAGLLRSDEVVVSGRRRRVYRLTGRGRRALAAQREEWRHFSLGVSRTLGASE